MKTLQHLEKDTESTCVVFIKLLEQVWSQVHFSNVNCDFLQRTVVFTLD